MANSVAKNGHRGLIAWQKAMAYAEGCLALARVLRQDRHHSLANQLERAAVSIPANIAEGFGRRSAGDFGRFLNISNGSLREADTLVDLGYRVGAVKRETAMALTEQSDELGKVLFGLRKAVLARRKPS